MIMMMMIRLNYDVLNQKIPVEYDESLCHKKLVGSVEESPATLLRVTGASQSLVLEGVLPFSGDSATGTSMSARHRTECTLAQGAFEL